MDGYQAKDFKKGIYFIGITLAVYLTMKYILPVVVPFLLGGFLAMVLHPLVDWLAEKTKKSRGLISMCIVVVVLAVCGVLFFFAGRAVLRQVVAFTKNRTVWRENMRSVWLDCAMRIGKSTGFEIGGAEGLFDRLEEKFLSGMQTKALPYLVKNSLGYARMAFTILGMLLISVVSGLMMLIDYPKIVHYFYQSRLGKTCIRIKQHAGAAGGTYLRAQLLILLIISGICVLGLFLLGNPYALLAGIGIGACDALPFVGTGIVFVPWILIEILNGHYWFAAAYGALYLISTFVRQLLEPRLIGERLGCPPILVLMSIYIGVRVYGGSGILLGPLSAFLIYEAVACKSQKNTV